MISLCYVMNLTVIIMINITKKNVKGMSKDEQSTNASCPRVTAMCTDIPFTTLYLSKKTKEEWDVHVRMHDCLTDNCWQAC